MRWYCLHPELPEKAVLRIRTAPNSSASVSGRVSKGKAIAALAPEFEIVDDTLSLAGNAGGAPQRWLHVLFPDELSGTPTEGYVMASLPDGMRLLVPWEQADFINCCYIKNASAMLFDGPLKTSAAVGLAEEGEGVKYPFGVAAVEGSRACILHDVLDSVWIEIAELEPVCVQLRHTNCSTSHAFYTLNEDLPPEAQIAIRCFPSKDAETVGLLSRGEVIEVVAQCGNWMQVAAAQGEGEDDDNSWIMWQTDSWTLLVEFPEHSTGKCTRHASFPDKVAEHGAVDTEQVAPAERIPDIAPASNSDTLHPTEDVAMSIAEDSICASHVAAASASATPTDGSSSRDEVEDLNDQFRDQSSLYEADAEMDGDVVESDGIEEVAVYAAEERAVPVVSWDERPLNVKSSLGNGESSSDKFEHDEQFQQKQSFSLEDDGSENELVMQYSSLSESTAVSWDDRPIRPQKQINWEESLPPAQDFDKIQSSETEGAHEQATESEEKATADSLTTQPRDEAESETLTSESGTTWDETPVGGGKPFSWDETPVGHPSAAASDEYEELAHPDQATASIGEEEDAQDEVPAEGVTSWDETPVGGSRHRVWDETPVGGSTHRSWEDTPVGGGKSLPWDEMPVGTQSRDNSDAEEAGSLQPKSMSVYEIQDEDETELLEEETELLEAEAVVTHDEIPVGGGNSFVWDETPIGTQSLPSTADEHDEETRSEPMTVDATEESDDNQVVQTESVLSWDETPVGGSGTAPRPWDEVPVGGGSKSHTWDEFPAGHNSASDGSGDVVDENEEMRAESMAVDGLEEGNEQDQVVETDPGLSWAETPVGDGGGRRVWDETPVGGASARHPWEDISVGARGPTDVHQVADVEPTEPDMHTFVENPARSRLARMLESDLLSSVYSSTSSAHVDVDQGQPGKLTLADLDEPAEATPTWEEAPVGGTQFEALIRAHDYMPKKFQHEAEYVVEGDDMPNAEIPGDDESLDDPTGDDWVDDTPIRPVIPPDNPLQNNGRWEGEQTVRKPAVIEGSDLVMSADDMMVDSAKEDGDHDSSQPVWYATPTKPAAHSHPDVSAGFDGQIKEDEEEFYDSHDAEKQLPDHTEAISDDKPTAFIQGAPSVTKRESTFGSMTRRVENRSSANGVSFAGHRTRKPELSHSENANGGLSFLMEFGIRAYCRHKQILITSNEELSRILFEAVVYGDDPEMILEALTADEPPCEDWMTFSPSKVRVVSSDPDPTHNFLDVLYARDSGDVPATPKQLASQQTQQLRTPPHSSGARKVKIDRMFNRIPAKQRPTHTYDLIMNNADVDKILEAEFGNEACELSILGPYKYPTLTGSRMVGKSSRSPIGDFSMGMSGLNRFSSAMHTLVTTEVESKASIAPGHALRTSEDVPPRMTTPPMEEMTNPLKRAASAIAKTPPVHDAKAPSAASAVSAPAAQVSVKQSPAALPPPASRLGSRLSSTVSSLGTSSVLRRPSPQPTALEQALPRPRSSLTSTSSANTARSSITGTLPKPSQSLLQRKSFLPTPSPAKSVASPSTSRGSMAGQIAQATDTSSMAARRTSFGFVRPKTAVPATK